MVADARNASASTFTAEARLLEATIAHMDQGLFVLDRDLNLVLWNRRYEELCGIPLGFLRVGLPIAEVARLLVQRGELGPHHEGLLDEYLGVFLGARADSEIHLPRRRVTLRVSHHPLPDGGSVATLTDISHERHALERAEAAESAAEKARARLMTALEAITQGFALYDADDRLAACNQQYLQDNIGGDIGEAIGRRYEAIVEAYLDSGWRGYLPGSDALASPEEWLTWRLSIHREPPPEPIVYQGANGRWVMISEKRLPDGGTVVVRVDVTDLKRAEHELRVARDQAEAAGQAKNEFLASMSHELRTPLNAIMGFAEILKGEMFGSLGASRYRGYANDIFTSASYLLELIRDVLDMSKIEAGRMDLLLKPIDVGQEIDRCLGMVGDSARSAGLIIETRIPTDMPSIRADSRAFRQILLNLLSNAIKFTPSGGRISISVAVDGDRARIEVADTGIGIPAGALPRLGRPFEQVDNVLQRKRGGSGLGLALSRALADLMNGTISIESTEGKGTRVALRLPLILPRATE
ncbi:MAG: PAS domain-containing protein [Alphaproteobacteria bacterium]|nr:PAS domain-containing protein [Alphaproteobacteria bacterium]